MQVHTPAPLAVAVHTTVLLSLTVTTAPASAVPLMPGFGATVFPLPGAVMAGAVTTVSFACFWRSVEVPPTLVCAADHRHG